MNINWRIYLSLWFIEKSFTFLKLILDYHSIIQYSKNHIQLFKSLCNPLIKNTFLSLIYTTYKSIRLYILFKINDPFIHHKWNLIENYYEKFEYSVVLCTFKHKNQYFQYDYIIITNI